jgi:hypothetical protein
MGSLWNKLKRPMSFLSSFWTCNQVLLSSWALAIAWTLPVFPSAVMHCPQTASSTLSPFYYKSHQFTHLFSSELSSTSLYLYFIYDNYSIVPHMIITLLVLFMLNGKTLSFIHNSLTLVVSLVPCIY